MTVTPPNSSNPPDVDTPTDARGIRGFLAQLWKRHVLRVAGVYLLAAWVVVQVADTVFPALGFPAVAVTFVVVLAILGLPFSMLLAWAFELTPDAGLQIDPNAPRLGGQTRWTVFVRRVLLPTAGLGIVVLTAAWYTLTRPGSSRSENELAPENIAVLYFDDLSPEQSLSHIANGLTESLIDELTHAGRLSVVSRNGVAPYRGNSASPDSIGRALSAGTLVSGSVMRARDRVRVTVQLIDANDGKTESHQIERPDGDVFALIDELVRTVSKLLRDRIGDEVRIRRWRAAANEAAWTTAQRAAVLSKGVTSLQAAGDVEGAARLIAQADSLYERAQALDEDWHQPTVERGWLKQREAMLRMHGGPPGSTTAELLQIGVGHADHVLVRDSLNAAALELRGILRQFQSLFASRDPAIKKRFEEDSRADLQAAVDADSSRARALSMLGSLLLQDGRLGESLLANERAYRADPFLTDAVAILQRLFESNFELGRDTAAARWTRELHAREGDFYVTTYCRLILMGWSDVEPPMPDSIWPLLRRTERVGPPQQFHEWKPRLEVLAAGTLARAGLADSARAVLRRARQDNADPELLHLEAGVRRLLGDHDAAERLITEYRQARPGVEAPLRGRRVLAAHPLTPSPHR